MILFVTGETLIDPLKEAVSDCYVIRKPIDVVELLELLKCFKSDAGYGSAIRKEIDDRDQPDKM